MNDNGSLTPSERFDRLEDGMQDFRQENQKLFGEVKEVLIKHIEEDRALGVQVKASLSNSAVANSRLDAYEEKLNSTTRRALGGTVLLLLVFNWDKLSTWIKALL